MEYLNPSTSLTEPYTPTDATLFSAVAHNIEHDFIKVSVFQHVSQLL